MLQRFDHRAENALLQGGEALFRIDLDTVNQRIDEEAHHTFQLKPPTPGHRRADGQVALSAITMQNQREGAKQQRIKRAVACASAFTQRLRQRRRQREEAGFSAQAEPIWPWAIAGQIYRFKVTQFFAPPVQGAGDVIPLLLLMLPFGIIDVLNVKRGQIRRQSLTPGVIAGSQLAADNTGRPAIGNNMMQHDKQHMVTGAAAEQHETRQRRLL